MLISLNGWEVPPKSLRTYRVPGADRRLTLDTTAGPLLVALAADYHKTVRPIDRGSWDEGGFVNRDARGVPGRRSNHASGTAIDLNWREEGAQGSRWGRRFFAQVKTAAAIRALKKRYGACIAWGGDWRAKDYMHWEVRPGVSKAAVRELCRELGIDEDGNRKGRGDA